MNKVKTAEIAEIRREIWDKKFGDNYLHLMKSARAFCVVRGL